MSFFLWSAHRHPENFTIMGSLLSIFQKSVEKCCASDFDEYNSIVGQDTEYLPSIFAIYRINRFN